MDTIYIVILVAVLAIGCFLYLKAFRIFCFAEMVLNLPMKPLKALGQCVSGILSGSSLWSIAKFFLMGGVFVWSLVYIILAFINNGAQNVITIAFNGTTLGGFVQLMANGVTASGNFDYTAMMAAGLSSFLSLFYMGFTVNALKDSDCHPVLYWTLIPIFNVAFLFLSSLLGVHLADWCADAANFLVSLYEQLLSVFRSNTGNFLLNLLKGIGTGLLLLVMLYAALVTLATVIREYFASIMYGIFALAVLIVVGLVFQEWLGWSNVIVSILFLATFIGMEYIRASETANESFKEFMLDLG